MAPKTNIEETMLDGMALFEDILNKYITRQTSIIRISYEFHLSFTLIQERFMDSLIYDYFPFYESLLLVIINSL